MIKDFLARQAGRPDGVVGHLLIGKLLDKANAYDNGLGVEQLEIEPDDRVLDVGFGGGVGLEMVLSRLEDGSAVGVEVSEAMLERCRKRFVGEVTSGHLGWPAREPGSARTGRRF